VHKREQRNFIINNKSSTGKSERSFVATTAPNSRYTVFAIISAAALSSWKRLRNVGIMRCRNLTSVYSTLFYALLSIFTLLSLPSSDAFTGNSLALLFHPTDGTTSSSSRKPIALLQAAPYDSDNNSYFPRIPAEGGGLDLIDLNDLIFNPVKKERESNNHFTRATMDLVSCLDLSPSEATAFLTENPELLTIYTNSASPESYYSGKQGCSSSSQTWRGGGDLLSQLMYFQNEMGISRSRLTKMIIQHPKLVASTFLDHEHDIKSTMDILRDALNYTSTSEEWYNHISAKLRKHVYDMKFHRSDLRRMLNLYTNSFGLSTMELRRVILSHPRILEISPQTLSDKLDILQKDLGFSTADCKRLVTQSTSVLCCCLEKKSLHKVVDFLKDQLSIVGITTQKLDEGKVTRTIASVEGIQTIKHVLVECPHLLVLPIETRLAPAVKCLRDEILGEKALICGATSKKKTAEIQKQSTEQLRKIVGVVPEVLSYSVERNLRPKVNMVFCRGIVLYSLFLAALSYCLGISVCISLAVLASIPIHYTQSNR